MIYDACESRLQEKICNNERTDIKLMGACRKLYC